MSVTVNPPANAADLPPIQTNVTAAAAKVPYVGLKNAPSTWSSSAKSVYVGWQSVPHQPASWKVN